jgi:hypothetical protein
VVMSSQERHVRAYAALGWACLVCHSEFLTLYVNRPLPAMDRVKVPSLGEPIRFGCVERRGVSVALVQVHALLNSLEAWDWSRILQFHGRSNCVLGLLPGRDFGWDAATLDVMCIT